MIYIKKRIKRIYKSIYKEITKEVYKKVLAWAFVTSFTLMVIVLVVMGTMFSLEITGLNDTAILGGLIGFAGAIVGGILTLMGVRLTIKNNKENIQHQMNLEDKKTRDRELSSYRLNKAEQLLTRIEEFNITTTHSISLYIRIAQNKDIIDKLKMTIQAHKAVGQPEKNEELHEALKSFNEKMNSLVEESIKAKSLAIDKLNQAAASATTVDLDSREKFVELKEYMIEKDNEFSDAMFSQGGNIVDKMGQDTINEISDKVNPIQDKLSQICIDQLHYMKTGHYPVRKKQDA